MNALLREGKELTADYQAIECALKGVIGRYELPDDIMVTRYVEWMRLKVCLEFQFLGINLGKK